MNRLLHLILLSIAFLSSTVWADEVSLMVPCAYGQLDKADFNVAVVKREVDQKVYFYEKQSGYDTSCSKKNSFCQTKKYLIPNDEVVVGQEHGKWVCAFFSNKAYGTYGWLEKSALDFKSINETPALKSWIGRWKYSHNTIDISMDGNKLGVGGEALWFGAKQSDGYQSVHEGSLGGEMKPIKNRTSLDQSADDSCSAKFMLVSHYLIVSDNGQCGGANVRFDGIYSKR